MPRTADLLASQIGAVLFTGAGSTYEVQTTTGVRYLINSDNNGLGFRKSTDGGLTWSGSTLIFSGAGITNISVWYDRWSGIAAGLIHLAYVNSTNDDCNYRTINTESSDALSTETVIFAGASTAANGHLSICRGLGGNVYCKVVIDAGAEGGFFRLPNANVPNGAWDAARTVDEAIATLDQMILMPGFAADNQDMLALFYDNSATELSRKIYDDSANSWAEASIDTDCTFPAASASYPHFAAVPDLANSRLFVIMWNAVDAANQDLRCWTVTESAITAKTDVVANATDDCGLCALSLDTVTGTLTAFYCGKSDGSETWNTAVNVYYKQSTDAGSTWGAENKLNNASAYNIFGIMGCPNYSSSLGPLPSPLFACGDGTGQDMLRHVVPLVQPGAVGAIGI